MKKKESKPKIRKIKYELKSKKVTGKSVILVADGEAVGTVVVLKAAGIKKPVYLTSKPQETAAKTRKTVRVHTNETAAVKRAAGPHHSARMKLSKRV